jgi:hypothetical protein
MRLGGAQSGERGVGERLGGREPVEDLLVDSVVKLRCESFGDAMSIFRPSR